MFGNVWPAQPLTSFEADQRLGFSLLVNLRAQTLEVSLFKPWKVCPSSLAVGEESLRPPVLSNRTVQVVRKCHVPSVVLGVENRLSRCGPVGRDGF